MQLFLLSEMFSRTYCIQLTFEYYWEVVNDYMQSQLWHNMELWNLIIEYNSYNMVTYLWIIFFASLFEELS